MRREKGAGRLPHHDTSPGVVPFIPEEKKGHSARQSGMITSTKVTTPPSSASNSMVKSKKRGGEIACQAFSVVFVKTSDKV